ncbi:MAG: FecR family protein [Neptuniibacter sp.]
MKSILAGCLLLLISLSVNATTEPVGKVILSLGKNVAVSTGDTERTLKRNSEVFADDLLKTGEKGRLQIRFTDGSRLALKPGTDFKIAEYQFSEDKPKDGKALYKLLKGGMRTISGNIGKVDREDYKLEAVVATIGIRGTDFEVNVSNDQVTGQVNDGAINVKSDQDDKDILAGRSFALSRAGGPIQVFRTPASSGSGEGSSGGGSESGEEDDTSSDEGTDSGDAPQDVTPNDGNTGPVTNPNQQQRFNSTDVVDGGPDNSDPTTDPGTDPTTDPGTDPTTDPGTDPTTDPGTDPTTDPGTDPTTDPGTDPTTDPGTDPTTDPGTDPATDPGTDGGAPVNSPNPTGDGTAAPVGAAAAVSYTSVGIDALFEASGGSLYGNGTTEFTVDSTAGAGDELTGIYYVDPNPTDTDDCDPCTFSSENSNPVQLENTTLGGANITWGRWNGDFIVIDNGAEQNEKGTFHYIYSDSLTDSDVLANKSGSFLYGLSSNQYTAPEIETGQTGTLTQFSSRIEDDDAYPIPNRTIVREGTYFIVDWDSQTIREAMIEASVKDATANNRSYTLKELTSGVSLSNILNGGELKITGSCSGGECLNGTQMEGQMTIDFVGGTAQGAMTSFNAEGNILGEDSMSGETTVITTVTVGGTALLENEGTVTD